MKVEHTLGIQRLVEIVEVLRGKKLKLSVAFKLLQMLFSKNLNLR